MIRNRIRIYIQPKMLDLDPESKNLDPKHCFKLTNRKYEGSIKQIVTVQVRFVQNIISF
jgi:hypothetical protein